MNGNIILGQQYRLKCAFHAARNRPQLLQYKTKRGEIATWSVEAGDGVEHGIEPIYFRPRAVGLEAVHDHRFHEHDGCL